MNAALCLENNNSLRVCPRRRKPHLPKSDTAGDCSSQRFLDIRGPLVFHMMLFSRDTAGVAFVRASLAGGRLIFLLIVSTCLS